MSIYLGQLGSMVETLCASELPVSAEDRAQVGGGAGTLAPVRVRVVSSYGAGGRTWQFSRAAHQAHEANTVVSLARAQARSGAYLRFVPCNAPFMNMLTPQASEEFAGWSGALSPAGGATVVEPVYSTRRVLAGGTVLTDGTVMDDSLVMSGPSWQTEEVVTDEASYAGTTVVLASGAAQSPVVPLLGFTAARFGCFVQRVGLNAVSATLEAVNAAGSVVATASPASSTPTGLRRLTWLWEDIPTTAVGVRMRLSVVGPGGLTLAWPSITLGSRLPRFHVGQCAEAVWLTPPAGSPVFLTPERSVTATSYEIREVNV